MVELLAIGPQAAQRAVRTLTAATPVTLGREGELAVPWDGAISRRHATLTLAGGGIRVQRLPSARNPIFYQGQAQDDFLIAAGEQFVIGNTSFQVCRQPASPTAELRPPAEEHVFAHETLQQIHYRDAEKRIAVVGQLPELISSAANEADLLQRICNVLLAGIAAADVVAIVAAPAHEAVQVLDWDRRRLSAESFQPSERLVRRVQELQQSIVHVWDSPRSDPAVTWDAQHAWAMAVPVRGSASQGWTIYLAGHFRSDWESRSSAGPHGLRADVKFAELVGATLANVRQLQQLERQAASWRAFFSPVVLQAIGNQDPRIVLAPRECELTVLFCDLQGFSRTSERMAADLLGLLQQVSQALSLATRAVLQTRGVIGDFHGDAVMGFWGWPLANTDGIELACRAAVEIQREFARRQPEPPAEPFSIGIGIAAGRGVAGQIGSHDQVKVTAFGPVVNRAARLESLTRSFRVPILIDEACRIRIAALGLPDLSARPLGVVRPVGFSSSVPLAELRGDSNPGLADDDYQAAVRAFQRGEWDAARQALAAIPKADGPAAFLRQYLAKHTEPPPDWDGVLALQQK